jgi:hypothetical protein
LTWPESNAQVWAMHITQAYRNAAVFSASPRNRPAGLFDLRAEIEQKRAQDGAMATGFVGAVAAD